MTTNSTHHIPTSFLEFPKVRLLILASFALLSSSFILLDKTLVRISLVLLTSAPVNTSTMLFVSLPAPFILVSPTFTLLIAILFALLLVFLIPSALALINTSLIYFTQPSNTELRALVYI